jgi:thioredoxin-dependent peroxiredoxin
VNVVVLGCSADSVEMLEKFKEKFKLNFQLLSDPDFTVIESYGARRMKSFLGKSFLGIVRSSVLIDADGRIEQLWPNAKSKGHADQILGAIGES